MTVTARDVMPERRLRESYLKHAARAQLHRLWAAVERGEPFDDLLAEPTAATPMVAIAPGGAPPSIEDCRIDLRADGRIDATTADATVTATFSHGGDILPKLTKLDGMTGPVTPSSGVANRARSTVHHFIGLVEHPGRDPQPFRELLCARFALGYTPTPITTLAALDVWVRGPLSSVVASEHVIHSIDVRELGDGASTAEVRMTSQALFPDGSGAISRNTQSWTLHNAGEDRFPRIAEILIARDAVEFFGPAPLYETRERP